MTRFPQNFFGNRVLWFCMLITMLVTACATTRVTSVWKDPSYSGHPGKIMVIGVSKSPVNRRVFEEEIVRQIKAHGADAIASYTILPDTKQNDQAVIAKIVAEQHADTLLITRLVSTKTVQIYVPGSVYYPPNYYGTWRDYYGYGYQAIYTPGYVAEDEYAFVETNLYDSSSDKLIWAATSETNMRGSDQKLIKSYVTVLVNTMLKQSLLDR